MPIVMTALLSFAGTNIDDILILTLLFQGQRQRRISGELSLASTWQF